MARFSSCLFSRLLIVQAHLPRLLEALNCTRLTCKNLIYISYSLSISCYGFVLCAGIFIFLAHVSDTVRFCTPHPNIVDLLDALYTPWCCVMLMPLFDFTLSTTLENSISHQLPSSTVHRLCLHIAGALSFVHGKKVLHRDVHSANIMVREAPQLLFALNDFGWSTRRLEDAKDEGSPVEMTSCVPRFSRPPEARAKSLTRCLRLPVEI